MLKIRLIGLGRWGTNIYNTLQDMSGVEVLVEENADVDAVIVATPGATHAKVALPFIEAGLPTYIEKPMTTSLKDALRLKKADGNIFVGHIHLYNPAYLKAKELVKKIGRIKQLYFEGMAPGPIRDDMSVWWDWGPHGVSLALNLLGTMPIDVQAWGNNDVAQVRLGFPKKIEVFCATTWLSPEKRMKLTVIGARGSVVFDDRAEKKVALYRGDKVTRPRYGKQAPLKLELEAFIKSIKTKKQPVTDINNGLAVVKVLATADKSLKLDGRKVECFK